MENMGKELRGDNRDWTTSKNWCKSIGLNSWRATDPPWTPATEARTLSWPRANGGIPWRAMLRHGPEGRFWPSSPITRTRRSASLQG